jgi:serine/threonine protein phosphatase PrpC
VQGPRDKFEDAHASETFVTPFGTRVRLWAVLDGHGGASVARTAGAWLPRLIEAEFAELDHVRVHDPRQVARALKVAFVKCHRLMHARGPPRWNEVGSTACVCVLVDDTRLYCANAGDSRAVLVRNGKSIALSVDHKPSTVEEQRRIYAMGSRVHRDEEGTIRILELGLSVSRGLGDFASYSRELDDYVVSPVPDVRSVRIDAPCTLVVACDGLWDVMENSDVAAFLSENPAMAFDPNAAARGLVSESLRRRTGDNVTAVVALLS